jgi:hypothetical protein
MVGTLNKWMSITEIVGAIAIFSMAACSGATGNNNKDAAADGATSSFSSSLVGGVFDGNSVRVVAAASAKQKYRFETIIDGSADSRGPC